MKSIKIIAAVASGLLALGVIGAQAHGSLNINITTMQQGISTNGLVTTFTSTPVAINNATILAKVASTMGITLPAGAKLAVSTTDDSLNGINVGDVVILSAQGVILWDLNNLNTSAYRVSIQVDYNTKLSETKYASKSTSVTEKGKGYLYIDILKKATETTLEAVGTPESGWTIDNYDNLAIAQYTRGNAGSQLTTGSLSFSGAAEFYSYDTGNYQPANQTVTGAATSVPWSTFRYLYNNNF